LLPPPTPSRSIITDAATFSAARLLPPKPSAPYSHAKYTATWKTQEVIKEAERNETGVEQLVDLEVDMPALRSSDHPSG
jgi:hypothetical protein